MASKNGTKLAVFAGASVMVMVLLAAVLAGVVSIKPASVTANSNGQPIIVTNGGSSASTVATGLRSGTDFKFLPYHFDTITGAAKTEGTHVTTYVLSKAATASGYTFKTPASTSAVQIPYDGDDGFVYFTSEAASGQTFALDTTKFDARTSKVGYIDVEGDSNPEWVLKYDTVRPSPLANSADSNNIPTVGPTLQWFNVDSAVTLTAPSAVTSIGTGTVPKSQFVKVTATAQKAQIYKELQISFNSTSTSKWDESNSWIKTPFGTYKLSQATSTGSTVLGATTAGKAYYFRLANDQSTAPIVTIPTGGAVDRYDEVKITWTLSSSDVINVKVAYVTMSATDSTQASSSVNFNNSY